MTSTAAQKHNLTTIVSLNRGLVCTRRREAKHAAVVSRLRRILLQLVPATSATDSPARSSVNNARTVVAWHV